MPPSPALFPAQARPAAEVQLLFLHHAGGSSYPYLQLAGSLAPSVEVFCLELAGRGTRFAEPFEASAAVVLADILATLQQLRLGQDKPLLLFGHSLGAELAFQVASRLVGTLPVGHLGLVLSARGFVDADALELFTPRTDADILRLLDEYGGTPRDVMTDPELRRYVIRAMRNDLRLLASLSLLPKPVLDLPIDVIGGDGDASVTGTGLDEWRQVFAAAPARTTFRGGHFYLFEDRDLVRWIASRAQALAQRAAALTLRAPAAAPVHAANLSL